MATPVRLPPGSATSRGPGTPARRCTSSRRAARTLASCARTQGSLSTPRARPSPLCLLCLMCIWACLSLLILFYVTCVTVGLQQAGKCSESKDIPPRPAPLAVGVGLREPGADATPSSVSSRGLCARCVMAPGQQRTLRTPTGSVRCARLPHRVLTITYRTYPGDWDRRPGWEGTQAAGAARR